MNWKSPVEKRVLSLTLFALVSIQAGAADSGAVNLASGGQFTADSFHAAYTPDKAGDGNDKDKASRWVSNAEPVQHWLEVDFKKETCFNHIVLKFWTNTHIAVDFDIQKKTANDWQTVREIRGNVEQNCSFSFPPAATAGLRILFKKIIPDNMIRVYELEVYNLPLAMEAGLSGAFYKGILCAGQKPELKIRLYKNTPEKLSVNVKLAKIRTAAELVADKNIEVEIDQSAAVELPVAPEYGEYSYDITVKNSSGVTAWQRKADFLFFPPGTSPYLTASPFGAHYYDISPVITQYIGMRWWRNHDVYGLWHYYADEHGGSDWSELEERLNYVRDNQLRPCYVLIGAPRRYSTVLPGEKCLSGKSEIYAYYPPSDLQAWVNDYIQPVTAMVKKSARFRVYEIWNEAWSYYRLRGLHGTAGEAFELFKVSYEALKKADPRSMAYSTDVKPEASDNKYAFRNFGRDLLDLGYLRYTDLLSYHGYGMANPKLIERIRRNAWDYGRDFELWSTETAVEGRPFYELMESLVLYRASGNGKTFIYNGTQWVPLMENDVPTMNLVGQAALIRNLGDTLPLGYAESDGVRQYLFVNGGKAVAVLFTDSAAPVKINVPLSAGSEVTDVFGRKLNPLQAVLTRNSPVFVNSPAMDFIKMAMAEKIKDYAAKALEKDTQSRLGTLADKIIAASDANLGKTLNGMEQELRKQRRTSSAEFLYSSNNVLDLLTNCRIMLARSSKDRIKTDVTLDAMREKLAAQWKAVIARTGNNGALLNTERLTSRAQKQIQYAAMYEDDNDAVARDILLACAADDLANAQARTSAEPVAGIYKTKTYFRSHKRSLRSELFCFLNDQWQEAVITLANPFGKTLSGNLALTLPAGWQARPSKIAYQVGPISRQLLKIELKAPAEFKADWQGKIEIKDENGNFPAVSAQCEIVREVPPCPVLVGELISSGTFTGN
ncbi:MAG: discoidin domain-containing protein [Victivallaceae bacterium]|jgi:hypothetical protein